jgi:putative membrane protein
MPHRLPVLLLAPAKPPVNLASKRMRMRSSIFIVVALAVAGQLRAQDAKKPAVLSTELSGKDLQFLTGAMDAAVVAANVGELTKSRGASDPVKLLGEAVSKIHIAEKAELERLANSKGVPISSTPNPRQITAIDTISKLTGETLEKACLDEIVRIEQKEAADFDAAMKSGDADVRAFAERFLPQFKEQSLLAQKIAGIGAKPTPSPGATPAASPAAKSAASPAASPAFRGKPPTRKQ